MRRPSPVTIIVSTLLVTGAIILGRPIFRPGCVDVTAPGDAISIALADLPAGAAKFFCLHDSAGAKIRFLLARDTDGHVHSVFDACRRCYRFHKGYTVADGYLICRLCGNRYKLGEMQKGFASCVPVGINASVDAGKVKVKVADLEKGRSLF